MSIQSDIQAANTAFNIVQNHLVNFEFFRNPAERVAKELFAIKNGKAHVLQCSGGSADALKALKAAVTNWEKTLKLQHEVPSAFLELKKKAVYMWQFNRALNALVNPTKTKVMKALGLSNNLKMVAWAKQIGVIAPVVAFFAAVSVMASQFSKPKSEA